MRTERNDQKEAMITLRLWTYPRALRALPYLTCVLRSLRDYWLERQQARRTLDRLVSRCPVDSKSSRRRLEAQEDAERAEKLFLETLDELGAIDVYCVDALRGVAFIPFRLDDELAWFVFDLFSSHGLAYWRLHTDPLHVRREVVDIPYRILSAF